MSIQFPKESKAKESQHFNGHGSQKESGRPVRPRRAHSATALAFVMRTIEGRLLLGFLFAFNRLIRDLRFAVGNGVAFDEANAVFEKIRLTIEEFQKGVLQLMVKGTGESHGLGEESMVDLAQHDRAVFVDPCCQEVRQLGVLFHQFDRVVMAMRMGVHEWDSKGESWMIIRHQVWLVHGIVQALNEVKSGQSSKLPHGWEEWSRQNPLTSSALQ